MSEAVNFDPIAGGIPSPGRLLGARRKEFGWSLKDVARALRLSEQQILALEQDDYAQLPGKTYVMGYWRSYSQLLQINIEDSIQIHRANLSGGAKVFSIEKSHDKVRGVEEKSRKRVAFLFACLLAVFLGAVWYWQDPDASLSHWVTTGMDSLSGGSKEQNLDNEPTIESQISAAQEAANQKNPEAAESVLALPIPNFAEDQEVVEINTRGYEVLIEELPLSSPRLVFQIPDAIEDEVKVETQTATDSVSISQAATTTSVASASTPDNSPINLTTTNTVTTNQAINSAVPGASGADIVFQVVKESWIDVRDSTGERLIYRTVNRGEDIRLQGKPPYSIFIGSAEGVTVQYRGKVVPFKAHESGLFARFEVGG